MELNQNQFPHDKDNRIQKLYYDVNINTIFNRTKLQNLKNKFWKYLHYLEKYKQNNIQPKLLELEKIRDETYDRYRRARRNILKNFKILYTESIQKKELLEILFEVDTRNYNEMRYHMLYYNIVIGDIIDKITKYQNSTK